jgi:exodeoxyribonuclease VII large subunit
MTESPTATAPARGANTLPEYTVSEIAALLKRTIETNFAYVRVRGEISGFKRHSSGHCYFALKDEDAVLDSVAWRNTRLSLKPEDGMEVVCTGRLTTYPGRSRYQLVVESMELAGIGALLKLLEDRRKRLAAEGLFDAARKRKLPYLPEVIGIVTSPTGAVIRDILHRLKDRFPRRVLLWPVAVQGEGAAQQVAAAIEGFNRLVPGGSPPRPDLLIVARGGGSLEDLMAFNEEIVVRAAAASAIPLISAVGHETDTTLIDHASDRRAPTPTAAAEMAVPVRLELAAEIEGKGLRLTRALTRLLSELRAHARAAARGLPDPQHALDTATQRLDDRSERLLLALNGLVRLAGQRLDGAARRVTPGILSLQIERARQRVGDMMPRLVHAATRFVDARELRLATLDGRLANWHQAQEKVLEKGYVRVRGEKGTVLTDAAEVAPGGLLRLEFHDGIVTATASREKRAPRGIVPDRQGKLL